MRYTKLYLKKNVIQRLTRTKYTVLNVYQYCARLYYDADLKITRFSQSPQRYFVCYTFYFIYYFVCLFCGCSHFIHFSAFHFGLSPNDMMYFDDVTHLDLLRNLSNILSHGKNGCIRNIRWKHFGLNYFHQWQFSITTILPARKKRLKQKNIAILKQLRNRKYCSETCNLQKWLPSN